MRQYVLGLTWTYGLCDTEMRLGSSSNIPLQWARSWVAHTASYVDRPSSAQSVLTSSNHLFFGLPTGLEPWILPNKEMYGSRSAFILQTCPKYDKRRCCTSSTTVLGKQRVILMSSFLHLSLLVTPSILLRIVISNTKSLLLSELYSSMERTSERYTLNFVSWVMSFDAQMVLREAEAPVVYYSLDIVLRAVVARFSQSWSK